MEDFPGGHLMDRLAADPATAAPTVQRLAETLAVMRRHRTGAREGGPHRPGRHLAGDLVRVGRPRVRAALPGQRRRRDRRMAAARDRLADRLREFAAAVRPRTEYAVVHGELGLHHVLVDAAGAPVLIDIEDLMYFRRRVGARLPADPPRPGLPAARR